VACAKSSWIACVTELGAFAPDVLAFDAVPEAPEIARAILSAWAGGHPAVAERRFDPRGRLCDQDRTQHRDPEAAPKLRTVWVTPVTAPYAALKARFRASVLTGPSTSPTPAPAIARYGHLWWHRGVPAIETDVFDHQA